MRTRTAIAALFLLLGACSGDSGSGAPADNNGWQLNNETNGGTSGSETNGIANNGAGTTGATNGGTTTSSNNGTGTNTGGTNGTSNNASTNNGTSTSGTTNTTPGGGLPDGSDCTVNSECSGDLTCCAGFDGQGTCQDQCFGGGLCGGDDAECPSEMECCDLSGIGAPDSCLDRCRGGGGGGGNMGMACMANSDCAMGEVCCPGFDGNATCRLESDCLSGGVCEQDADCSNGQMCCDLSVTKVCLDQCSF